MRFTKNRRKLLARTFANYSVLGLGSLVVGQLPSFGTAKFSLWNSAIGVCFAGAWLFLSFLIEPEKEEGI